VASDSDDSDLDEDLDDLGDLDDLNDAKSAHSINLGSDPIDTRIPIAGPPRAAIVGTNHECPVNVYLDYACPVTFPSLDDTRIHCLNTINVSRAVISFVSVRKLLSSISSFAAVLVFQFTKQGKAEDEMATGFW
jgi:hypothetical protein